MLRGYHLKSVLLAAMAAFALSLSGVAQDSDQESAQCPKPSSWSYPATKWAEEFSKCCSQTNPETKDIQQSPIDIRSSAERKLTLAVHYDAADVPVLDKSYTIEVEYEHPAAAKPSGTLENKPDAKENYVTYNGEKYTLQQFHFHLPNEHQIKGKPVLAAMANMEVHLVHKAENGSLLVIGVLINQKTANEGFGKILANIDGHVNLDPVQMIPGAQNTAGLKFYTYKGSLTTPACAPQVTWVVLKDPITISPAQLTTYKNLNNGKYVGTSRGPQRAIPTLTVERNFEQ